MHEDIMEAIKGGLKDHGIDWILEERGSLFKDLVDEIELAVSKVLD